MLFRHENLALVSGAQHSAKMSLRKPHDLRAPWHFNIEQAVSINLNSALRLVLYRCLERLASEGTGIGT
jgi:hypothetical protein